MTSSLCTIVALALLATASGHFIADLFNSSIYAATLGGINPTTVATLDVAAFSGTWLQMASDKIVLSTFEVDAYCATATYEALPDGKISVHNYATIGSAAGDVFVIDGYAYVPDADKPGQLKVHFTSDNVPHSPFDAPYWVLQTGPVVSGKYEWAIVSDNLSMTLFVLARNAATYDSQYKAYVSQQLVQLGFTGLKAPIDLYQGSDCVYDRPVGGGAKALSHTKAATKTKSSLYAATLGGINPTTVATLDVAAFSGTWLQMASDKIVLSTFEVDAYCATATYEALPDGKISVHNYATIGSAAGDVFVIDGYAYVPDADKPGQLKVHFTSDNVPHSPFDAPYWVLQTGPVVSGKYEWAIVSDNLSMTLFVLARNAATYDSQYKAYVSQQLVQLGFTGLKAPIDLYQGSDCVYDRPVAPAKAALKSQHSYGVASLFKQPTTVAALELTAYAGRWYQVYGDALVFNTILQGTPSCVTADYKIKADGTLSVRNYEIVAKTGAVSTIDGYAYVPSADQPGQLKVHFDTVPFDGSYWVLALGPKEGSMYAWSIVSDSTGLALFVLARDPDAFKAKYDADVLALLTSLGFTGLSKPLPVPQGGACTYETY